MSQVPESISVNPMQRKKPDWLRVKLPIGENYKHVRQLVDQHKLHTICESGNCPNMGECWGAGTATFMILGNVCTRSCGFCSVATGRPEAVDWDEPQRVAEAIPGFIYALVWGLNVLYTPITLPSLYYCNNLSRHGFVQHAVDDCGGRRRGTSRVFRSSRSAQEPSRSPPQARVQNLRPLTLSTIRRV